MMPAPDDIPKIWVSGWMFQSGLIIASAVLLWNGRPEQGSIFIVGAMVIGVIRQIEKERRAIDAARENEVEP